MNFSKEQAQLLLPLLQTLTDACINEDEREGGSNDLSQLSESFDSSTSTGSKPSKYSAKELYTAKKRSGNLLKPTYIAM